MYYVIETNYSGPNPDQYIDYDTIVISTTPARYNGSGEPCTDGWAGTNNDRSVHAHGEYPTIEDATAAITDLFGDVRGSDCNGYPFEPDDPDILQIYKPGKYAPMSVEETGDWLHYGMRIDITNHTTTAELHALLADYEAAANECGYTLNPEALGIMSEYRDGLIAELSAEEE